MIGYLSGKILEHADSRLVVGLGSPDGHGVVGYTVTVPQNNSHLGLLAGQTVELFIHTHVREDALDLFGFRTRAEKDLFLTLLGVNGIGPKAAINILSGAEAGQLIQAIIKGDKDFLTQVPGIGKKTAERIVLELGDKIRKRMDAGDFAQVPGVMGGARPSGAMAYPHGRPADDGLSPIMREAKDALLGLGYREQDALAKLNRVLLDQNGEVGGPPAKVEDLILAALRQ